MAEPPRRCRACQTAPVVGLKPGRRALAKAEYCAACRREHRTRPPSTLTPAQGAEVLRLAGHVPHRAIERQLGVSEAAVTRFLREQGVKAGHYNTYPPEVVAAVLVAYEAAPRGQGKARVQEQFPDVAVRSIVERYRHFRPRQIRWTAPQLVEAARMAGLVSRAAQSRWFGRPHANDGSIRALWVKRFKCSPHDLNGLAAHCVYRLCGPGTPAVLVPYQPTGSPRALVLWLTLHRTLPAHVDPAIREAIAALAQFQRWLWDTDNPELIMAIIREREGYGDDADPRHAERPTPAGPGGRGVPRQGDCDHPAGADGPGDEGGGHAGDGTGGLPVCGANIGTLARASGCGTDAAR